MMNLATCAGFFACQACTDCLKATMKQQVRLSYILFNGFFIALTILIVYWLADLLNSTDFMMTILKDYIHCPADQGFSCLGISAVYRISLALVIFHAFILLFVLMRNGCSKVINEEVWPFKILMVLVVFVALFFISNEFFETYSTIAMIASLFFLVFQVVMIIDLFYLWGENWVSKYDQGSNFFMYALIIVTLAIYGGVIYWVVKSFNWFGGCGVGTLANTVNIVFIVLDALIIFAGLNPNGSLLTTGAVSGYSTYLIWSGLSNMEESCNPLISEEFTTVFHMVFGLIVIVASLIYVSVGSSEKTSGQVAPGGVDIAKGLLADKTPMTHDMDYEEGIITRLKNHDLQVYQENSFIYFHLIMILAACYVAMLLSNWGAPVIGGQQFFQFQASTLSMWIKIGVAWTTMTLYTWTLIAPRLCPDRDFN